MTDNTAACKIGLLFVHGIVGNSRFFDFLMPEIPEKCKVLKITLKGHGGNALDFSGASMEQWKRQVDEAICLLRAECGTIVFVAHSMGTLFALDQAARNRVNAIFLLNPPLRIRPTWRLLTTPVKVMTGYTSNPVISAAKDAYGISLDYNPLHYYGWPRRYMELFSEIKRIRRIVHKVNCVCKVFISERDEMVSPSSAALFNNNSGCRLWLLSRSGHYYYTPSDRNLIIWEFSLLMMEMKKFAGVVTSR